MTVPLRGALRSGCRLIAYVGWTLALLPVQLAALAARRSWAERIPLLYHRGVLAIIGMRIERIGVPSPARPTLFVCSHSSYLDIEALGALAPGCFVAKREVASWPMFGHLARLQRSVFIDRSRLRAADHRDEIAQRLEAGDNLFLFPEGTSNDGNRVLPFKSALFAAANHRGVDNRAAERSGSVTIQPVSIAYTRINGAPLMRHLRPQIAWYGDMTLGGHFWRMLGLGSITAVVEFHPPVAAGDFPSRKALSDHCQGVVAAGVSRALQGRSSINSGVAASQQAA